MADEGIERFTAKAVSQTRAQLGEGPVWSARDGELFWTDISGCALHAFSPATGAERCVATTAPRRVGCFARCATPEPLLLCAAETRVFLLNLRTHEETSVAEIESSSAVRFNDGKVAPSGHFLAGTMSDVKPRVQGAASLFSLAPGAGKSSCERVDAVGGVTVSNGLAWSADGRTLFYVDTPTRRIVRFGFDPATGAVAGPATVVLELGALPGGFDGMTIDTRGRLWVALFRGSAVVCVDGAADADAFVGRPARVVAIVDVPARLVTSCCFGGPELRTLYITTASGEEDPGNPLAGALFAAEVGGVAAGCPLFEFDPAK